MWQAAQSLSSLLKKEDNFYEFRLGFDTTETGLYILPFKLKGNDYYISAIYNDVDNPARLKRNLRLLKENLEIYLTSVESADSNDEAKVSNEYLFDNITDDEMDNLFSF